MVILEPQMTIFVALNNAVERRIHSGESGVDDEGRILAMSGIFLASRMPDFVGPGS
jgi:hypothetical protein